MNPYEVTVTLACPDYIIKVETDTLFKGIQGRNTSLLFIERVFKLFPELSNAAGGTL